MRTADDFYHLIGMITFLHFIDVFLLVFPSSSLYYSTRGRQETLWGEKLKNVPFIAPLHSIFLRVYLVKMSSKKAGNGISGTPTWKISWRSMLPDPLSNFSSRAYNHQANFIIFHRRWRINGKFAQSLIHQKNAEARNCNQPFNLMVGKRANFIVASKV